MALTWIQIKNKINTYIGDYLLLRGSKHNEIMSDIIDSCSLIDSKVSPYSQLASAPTVDADLLHSYFVGYELKALDTNFIYVCKNNTNGNAVWELKDGQRVPFKVVLLPAQIYVAGLFDIAELPAPGEGYAWAVTDSYGYLSSYTELYDGENVGVIIKSDGGSTYMMFEESGSILQNSPYTFISFGTLISADEQQMVENKKVQIFITNTSTVGDGILTIYGTGRLIKL